MPQKGKPKITPEDEWLEVQSAQANPRQFRVLYDRYYTPIFRFVYKRTLEESLTADITSRVFLKAMQNIGRYVFKGLPFSAWLYRIAGNEVTQHFRNTSKNRIVCLEEHYPHQLNDEQDDKEDIEWNLSLLQLAIQELKVEEVTLLELRFFEQRSFREVGAILEITENNAKVKTYRLLAKMKKIILKLDDKSGQQISD